jgi:DnaK suppressor protein
MPDTSQAKATLEAQLAELEDRLARIEGDLAEPPDPDSSERAVQMEDDASLEGQAALISNEIASVRRALERIEDGSYGECVNCGNEISEGRLEARPEAALCIKCASAGAA